MAKNIKASNEHAQFTPRLAYMGVAANGRQIAAIDLVVLAADCAEAEYCLYASVI